MYEYDSSDTEVIFNGGIKLPLAVFFVDIITAVMYWVECLSDARRIVSNAQWHVHMSIDLGLIPCT